MASHKHKNIALIGVGDIGQRTVNCLQVLQLKNVLLAVSDADSPNNVHDTLGQLLFNQPEIVFVVADLNESTEAEKAAVMAARTKEAGILSIGFVTTEQSLGVTDQDVSSYATYMRMKQGTDATFVVAMDKFRLLHKEAAADKVSAYIAHVVQGVAGIVTTGAELNVDILDVRTVLEWADKAVIGNASANGQNRAMAAVQRATDFSLLTHSDLAGAGRILLSITSGTSAELEMDELTEIVEYIQDKAGQQAEMIFGHAFDEKLQDSIQITLIAACFSDN